MVEQAPHQSWADSTMAEGNEWGSSLRILENGEVLFEEGDAALYFLLSIAPSKLSSDEFCTKLLHDENVVQSGPFTVTYFIVTIFLRCRHFYGLKVSYYFLTMSTFLRLRSFLLFSYDVGNCKA